MITNIDLYTKQELESFLEEHLNLKLKVKKLEQCIKDFKEYDIQRKEYYRNSQIELGKLQSYVDELEQNDKITKRYHKVKEQLENYKTICHNQEMQIKVLKESGCTTSPEKIQIEYLKEKILKLEEQVLKLKEINLGLNNQLKQLRDSNNNLIYRLHGGIDTSTKGE